MTRQNLSQQESQCSSQAVSQGIHKTAVIFCMFTTVLLLVVAFLMDQIGHSPWGLTGAAILVVVLTVQQLMRKPTSVVAGNTALNGTRGVA